VEQISRIVKTLRLGRKNKWLNLIVLCNLQFIEVLLNHKSDQLEVSVRLFGNWLGFESTRVLQHKKLVQIALFFNFRGVEKISPRQIQLVQLLSETCVFFCLGSERYFGHCVFLGR